MSSLKKLLCSCLVLLCVSVLPTLPQQCNQFIIEPPVGPGMPLIIPEGGSTTLTCRHVSPDRRPPFTINWFRETTVIRPSDEADTSGECSCEVQPIDPLDSSITARELNFINFAGMFTGEYSCRSPDNDSLSVEASCRFQVLLAVAPSIGERVPQQNRTLEVDGTLEIPVEVTGGFPSPTITWRNSSTELFNNSRVTIDASGGLTVTGVTLYDRGNYTLNVSNVGGNLIKWFSLFVPFVEITNTPGPRADGNQISAECVAAGYPRPSVVWQDSLGNAVASDIRTTTTEITNTYETIIRTTIIVDRFNCQPQRTYKCSARNTAQSSTTTQSVSVDLCDVPLPPPAPTNVMVVQNGPGSVLVTWEIVSSSVDFTFEVCYTRVTGGSEVCPGSGIPKTTREYVVGSGLEIGVNYTFRVRSVNNLDQISSNDRTVILSPCSGEVSVQVFGVSVNTAVNEGERTFNISWRGVQVQDNSDEVFGYKVQETKRGWSSVVNQRVVTNLITPANFCNGEDHSFVVMAINNCGLHGPPSAAVIGTCKSPGRIKIISVSPSSTSINVTWALKESASSYSIQPPLSITVLKIQIDSKGQQLLLNYSTDSLRMECLGGLEPSTTYKVCLHPMYSDGLTQTMPVCMDTTTKASDGDGPATTNCLPPKSTTMPNIDNTVRQALLPDYAIALIVIGVLMILAMVFCCIGVCFACSNNKSKDIDDMGSEYSSSIAAGMGMQGRMSSNHNRNMSPTRSCLSYHSKGHSTNWNDHMGTLREMETEVGTNV